MRITLYDEFNDLDYALEIEDESKAELVGEIMIDGLKAWYCATCEINDTKYFTDDEIKTYYYVSYTEPALEKLKEFGIEVKLVNVIWEDEDHTVAESDMYVRY